MDSNLSDVESLTLCTFCKQKFNSSDLCPKLLQCKHYFCLKCIQDTMIKGQELSCINCWKRQEIDDGGAVDLPTHTPTLALITHLTTLQFSDKETKNWPCCGQHGQSWSLWCTNCHKPLCSMCFLLIEHCGHQVISVSEAKQLLSAELQAELTGVTKLLVEIHRLSALQREFQLKILEACVTLKTCVEADIAGSYPASNEIRDARELLLRERGLLFSPSTLTEMQTSFDQVTAEKHRLEARYQELALQCKMEEIISAPGVLLDLPTLSAIHTGDWSNRGPLSPGLAGSNPTHILLLANYCLHQLYSRSLTSKPASPVALIRNPTQVQSRYFFNVDLNLSYLGRFVIETRPDLAPRMSRNFEALCLGETGPSYRNCSVFQCWEGESIITGDYETNNGRGGRSIFEEAFFMPDETKMAAVRGAVGMRRTQKKHDNLGLVGSQFRIILQDMRGFSGIFGHVVEGIDVIEKIAACGDQTGKPTKSIIISACGKL